MKRNTGARHPGLASLFRYPLMSAIAERRTRRISRGTSVTAAGLSHTSANPPAPLTALEEAVLVVSTGLTGATMHDGPLQTPDGSKELGTPFVNVIGRSASSPDNAQATSFFLINDSGIWLINRLKGHQALSILKELPPKWKEWSEADWLTVAEAVKHRISDQRLEFPRRFPYYIGWNKQISNRPGTTIFFPVVDCTRAYINILLILLSEPDGERPLFIDDWQKFKPRDLVEAAAWAAVHLGFVDKEIPYQPVGGIERARGGFVNPDINLPLGLGGTMRVDYEAFFLLQNLMLVGQAMGLGGWIHAAVAPPYISAAGPLEGMVRTWFPAASRRPRNGMTGLPCHPRSRIRSESTAFSRDCVRPTCGRWPTRWTRFWPRSMTPREPTATWTYSSSPIGPKKHAVEFLRNAEHYSKEAIEYTKEICTYIYDTYGRFPAHVNAFHTPGIWLQFSHLELEYYQKFYNPALFRRQAQHETKWGKH